MRPTPGQADPRPEDHARKGGRYGPSGNTRTTGTEQFHTPRPLAARLARTMADMLGKDARSRTWIEPAGGTGAFVDALLALGTPPAQIISYDIEPRHPLVARGDFLVATLHGDDFVAIGNPPFGRANALSVRFFNALADHATHIGFIVPRSWRKWSLHDRLDARFHLVHDEDLATGYVDADGRPLAPGARRLNTVFQIWQRREALRQPVEVEDRGYIAKTTREAADVALVMRGFTCGTVLVGDLPDSPWANTAFFSVRDQAVVEALRSCDLAQFSRNAAWLPTLSIREVHHALNQWFDDNTP